MTDNKADSYVSVGKTGALRRISNVADGAADSDAATIAQLKKAVEETDASKKANIDASNIGENLKKADGKTAADSSDKKNNKDAWGNAIGTGKVEKNNGQLVTGGTVYSALENQKKDLSVHAGWGISVAKDKDGKAISLNRNLGRDAYTKDKAVLKADENKSALVIGGRVNPGDATGGQTAEKDYGALGQDSVTVGGADNTVRENGDAAVVVGGVSNTASAQYSTVIGGSANDALGNQSSVFGGHDNDAHGTYSTASGGSMNRAYGAAASVFGGGVNSALGDSSVAVGGLQSTVNGAFAVGIAGGSTNANHALAAGNGANVTVENGTAIGYQATTDEAGTIAFGHDAGDAYYSSTTWPQKATKQNGKYYDANNKEISKAKYDALKNSDGTWNDYSKTPTVVEKTYDKAAYNRLVKVADGKDDHDVVVMEQLTKATNDLTKDLSVNAGWGINVNDVTTKNDDGTETTTKNVISLNRNLGTNYGNKYGNGKVTFEADGENSLIIGGGAINDSLGESDKDFTFGAHAKDSVLVGGMNNDIDKNSERALIVGGTNNKTLSTNKVQQTGTDAIIVGGTDNKAEGDGAVLIGGNRNEASGLYSMTVGGTVNKNDGWLSSIFGGTRNNILKSDKSDPTGAAIFGGTDNTIEGEGIAATIFGGEKNVADNLLAVVVGGEANHSSGNASTVLGGNYNLANGTVSTAIGGQVNNAIGNGSVVVGGGRNLTSGTYSYASGGLYNNVTGTGASSLGGESSSVNGMFSTGVAGGSTGQDAFFSLAAGYQAVVADGGVEKTYLDENNPNDIKEMEKVEEAIQNGNIHSLPGYYMEDPESSLGNAKFIHYDKFSTALGYQATANEPGTIAFGHDAGDESGYTYEWETLTDEKGNPKQNEIDGTTNDYTKAPKSIKKNEPYTSAYYNRLVKVADGIDDHDVVVMEQLKQYAEKDASNLGNNIEVYKTDKNGNVQLDENKKPVKDEAATTTAQKKSKDDWGKALGADPFTAGTATTATNASTSDQLVTGKTLYNYDAPVAETGKNLNYVSANNTTGQNLSALDAQVADNASKLNDKTHNIKYYSVSDNAPTLGFDSYSNAGNDGAKGRGSLAAGFVTHADGIASTVAGSYSGVINSGNVQGLDLRGAAALSYGTFNVNQNTDTAKEHSGVANSIVGQANMTTNSNAAIIYGAGNTVTDSYRPIVSKKDADILGSISDPTKLSEAMQKAVKDSGGQVMVMGGGNTVDKAYMTQVTGVGNTVKGNQVESKGEWVTDTSNTAIKYDPEKSSQYNYVDGFSNEVINGKHDYVIGANNKLSGDSYDDDKAQPIKRSNKSNIVFGDNHTLTNTKNAVIIGSSDTQMILDKGDNATAIGHNASAQRDALAVGVNTEAGGNAVALGTSTIAHNNSIAIGTKATAVSSQNLAIGWEAHIGNIKTDNEKIKNAVALGSDSQVKVNDLLESDNNRGVLSIGDKDKERRIIHVRAGVNDTDAVNVSQLKSAQSDLTGKGLKFAANSGNEYTAKLGTTVKVLGTAKTEGHEYTADNLTTEIDKDGNITILMDKNVSAEKIAVNGKDGENGKPGTAGSIGISGQDGKAGVGIDGKDGISIKGQNGKDGVTIKGIDGVDGVDGAEGHIGLNGKDGMTDIFTTAGTPGLNGKDGETMTRIVYKDPKGTEHEAATLDDGLKFKGDDGKEIAKKLNNTLDIIGGAKGDLTEGNIGVNSTDKGQLKVQLAKDLKGITSISNQKTEGGKTTGAKVTLGADGSVDVNGGKITHVGSGADASGNYTTTTNAANIGDVQKIVKDAVDSAADTTNKALAGKANVDASNIGANLKGADGKAASAEAQKANAEKWGSAIGTGEIKADDGRMVTGKTVYDEVRPKVDGSYVKKDKTTGENLSALDSKIGSMDKDGNYIKKDDSISENLSTLDTQVKKNADDITNINQSISTLDQNAVKYDDSNKSKVTLAGKEGTTITNVKDGALSENSSDAVNGKQLYAEQQAREKADAEINQKVTNNTNEITKIKNGDFTDASKTAIHNIAKNAVKVVDGKNTTVTTVDGTDTTPTTYAVNVEGTGEVASGDKGLISGDTIYNELRPSADGSYIKKDSTTAQNLVSLDTQVKKTSDLINSDGKTIKIGGSDAATKIDVNGKDGKGRVITGVVSDANDPTSAANVGYVNNAYGRLNNNINKAAAGSNALAALHPLDYDPDDKADFAVGYGHYRNANAAAVGAFYHPNENTMVNVGVSLGNGDPGFNAGVSFKVGRGGAGREAMSKTEMAKVINSQSKEIDALKKDNADKDKRIDALEQKMAEILAKLDKNGK